MAAGNTPRPGRIAGIVLAGGQSSRMGRDKALLLFEGQRLIDHMVALLSAAGCADIFVSGRYPGYKCIPDRVPHEGPAAAIRGILPELKSCRGALFVPVDMPFLTPEILECLIVPERGAFFEGHPLPAYIALPCHLGKATAVYALLRDAGISSLPCPAGAEKSFVNLNTPDEWAKAMQQ